MKFRRELPADWTPADFDSFEVLAAIGRRHPARRVSRAHTPRGQRTVRRTVAAALRATRPRAGLHWPARTAPPSEPDTGAMTPAAVAWLRQHLKTDNSTLPARP